MGCQISAGEYEINYSQGAWLVAEMCSLWFDAERDMDDPKYGQQCWVDSSSFKAADSVIPNTLLGYLEWRETKGIKGYERDPLDDHDFETAREFVRNCAANDLTASLSH